MRYIISEYQLYAHRYPINKTYTPPCIQLRFEVFSGPLIHLEVLNDHNFWAGSSTDVEDF